MTLPGPFYWQITRLLTAVAEEIEEPEEEVDAIEMELEGDDAGDDPGDHGELFRRYSRHLTIYRQISEIILRTVIAATPINFRQ